MIRTFLPRERKDLYVVLVGELATAIVPTASMAGAFFTLSLLIAYYCGSPVVGIAAFTGLSLSLAKIATIVLHRRALGSKSGALKTARFYEAVHYALTLGFASHVGLVSSLALSRIQLPEVGISAFVLLFGYCSGIVVRVSFRPILAASALLVSALPVAVTILMMGDGINIILCFVFLLFVIGGLESIKYLYSIYSAQILANIELSQLARNDPLTGLLNRLGLQQAYREHENGGHRIAVYCFDLNGFKPVNDRYGHPTGDQLLVALARRLSVLAGTTDILARIGGDEFVIVHMLDEHVDDAEFLAQRILRAIGAPFQIRGHEIQISASLGWAAAAPGRRELDDLIAAADAALYEAKLTGYRPERATA